MKKDKFKKKEKFFTVLTSEEFHEKVKNHCNKKSCSMKNFIMTSIKETFVSLARNEKENDKKEEFLKIVDIIDKEL